MIMILLNKVKIPELTIVPPKMIISRTCGCQEKNVTNAKYQKISILKKIIKKKGCISEIIDIFKTKQNKELLQVLYNLYESFYYDIKSSNSKKFLDLFDKALRDYSDDEKDINKWQEIITLFQRSLSLILLTRKKTIKAYTICNQSRILISNTLNRIKEQQRNASENKKNKERSFGMKLSSTFDLNTLSDTISEGLTDFNIRSCYLALYENPETYRFPDAAPEWANLILAHTNGKRISINKDGIRFKSREIIPDQFMPKDFYGSYCVFPIYFRENQIGFAVYESDLLDGSTYNFITNQISSSLQ